jgi:hypothetical protein
MDRALAIDVRQSADLLIDKAGSTPPFPSAVSDRRVN